MTGTGTGTGAGAEAEAGEGEEKEEGEEEPPCFSFCIARKTASESSNRSSFVRSGATVVETWNMAGTSYFLTVLLHNPSLLEIAQCNSWRLAMTGARSASL